MGETQGGGPETQSAGAAQTAPDGGGQTSAQPAPETQADGATDRKSELDGLWRKAYREGQGKGRERERQALLSDLGVESIDELRERIAAAASAGQKDAEAEAERDAVEAKALRQLREERTTLAKELEGARNMIQRFQQQSKRALEMDVRGRLLTMGVIDGAADDAVGAVARNLRWSADGVSIEVVERDGDETIASRYTVDEYLAEFRRTKPWFFEAPRTAGSGGDNGRTDAAAQYRSPSDGQDFRSRLRRYRERQQ